MRDSSRTDLFFVVQQNSIHWRVQKGDENDEFVKNEIQEVKNTKELGKFRIIKEEASSAGVRRIKAVLE